VIPSGDPPHHSFFLFTLLRPLRSSLFPYTTLFRSVAFFVFGVGLALRVFQKGGTSVPRRYLAMVADNAVTTYCLMNMGEGGAVRSEEHTSELQSRGHLVCRLLLEKKKKPATHHIHN